MPENKSTNAPTMIVSNPPAWQRALYMVLFGLIAYVALLFVYFLSVAQFILTIINGQKNDNLCHFASRINAYLRQVLQFLSFEVDTVPFPFSALPESNQEDQTHNTTLDK